jgi:hypothetical protein
MSNKRINKAYVRYDGTGRVIPGSLILNRFKPAVGNWKETPAYLCCNGIELFFTPESYPIVDPEVGILCNGSIVTDDFAPGTANNINELVAILNAEGTSDYGYYNAQLDGSVKLTVSNAIKEQYCATGTLSFTILPD